MGLTTKLNTLLQNPLVETIINLIKKLKSSKSYWSVSYLILLFTIREAIAWKFGSAIQAFCETQATESAYPLFWDIVGFVFDVGGSIELVILGVFIFLVLSIVKVSEANGETKATPFKEKLLGFMIALTLMVTFFVLNHYQHKATVTDMNTSIQNAKDETNTHTTQEANKTRDHVTQALEKQKEDFLKELNIFGNKEKFLKTFFGDDWQKALQNQQTYHNLKLKLDQHQGDMQKLIKEKAALQKKIESRRLHSNGVQKMIDKAFKELRFDDVLDLLDNFIENNKELEKDLLNAHYQKALAYMEKIEYHKAKEEFETYISTGIKDTDILHDYGNMYYRLGEYDNYLEVNTKRLNLLLQVPNENRTKIATAYNEIGLAWESKGDYDKAIEFYTKSLKIQLATLGENHPSTATSYNNLGSAWYRKGEVNQALEFLTKAYKIFKTILGEEHPHTKVVKGNIEYLEKN